MKERSTRELINENSERRIRNNRKRRIRQRRRNVALFAAALTFVSICFFMISGLLVNAQTSQEHELHKVYSSIPVSAGDDLWSIAREHVNEDVTDVSSYVEEVRSINHLEDDLIKSGMYLVIPRYY
ncbi:MAG: LysM peptidoglycan-binding domain-containing protein [Lachnospiraceae bacterium]|nr:LysM peptidoglycan-binding domain-containing protein [Lachnospiraceae bacterium]